MNLSRKLLWSVYAGVIGAVSAMVAQKLVRGAWKMATGDEPPDPSDPSTPVTEAVVWALAGGVGIGVTQLLTQRLAADRWEKAMGTPAPTQPKVAFKL